MTITETEKKSQAIGGLVGYNMGGTAKNAHAKNVSVTGNACVAGLIGGSGNATISDCSAEDISITVLGDNDFSKGLIQDDTAECGGLLIGGSFGGTIDNCSASGTIKADGNEPVGLGGIGGCLEMMDSVTNCTADVTIDTQKGGHAIGGLCGFSGTHSNPNIVLDTEGVSTKNYPAVIENCKVTVKINAKDATHVGSLIGTGLYYYGEETVFSVKNCTVSGEINGAVSPGSIAGRAENSKISDCTIDLLVDGKDAKNEIGKTEVKYESADQ